jgi:phosphate-selective porin OprO/OprP
VQLENKFARALIALALIAIMIPASAAAGETTGNWKNGLSFADEDGNSVKIGGRVFADWVWYSADDEYKETALLMPEDGTEIRQARLFMSGKMHDLVSYKLQVDFASSSVKFKDVYIGLEDSPLFGVDILVGQFKQPLGLEYIQSSKYITFIERAQLSNYVVDRQSGVFLGRRFFDERMRVATSVFRNSNGIGESVGDNTTGFAGRWTGVPWMNDEGSLLHIGVGAATRGADTGRRLFSDEFFRTKPESALQPAYAFTRLDSLDRSNFVDLEGAVVLGPFSVQGEYMMMNMSRETGDDANFTSWYGQASWFLTGESRPYSAKTAVFGRVKPKSNYTRDGGTGAVELAARYSSTDLDDGPYQGGTLDAITLGANWYLNPNTRLMFNWVRSDGESPDPTEDNPQSATGVVNTFQTRFQVDF